MSALGTTNAGPDTTQVTGSSSVGPTTGGASASEQQRHTTSVETITEQTKHHWILKEHIKVDTSMLAGHIIGIWRVHPKACNERVSHVSQMFMTWQGGMRVRASPIGTFQFGGLIGISKLPPKFINASEIQQLSFQTLSAYPGIQFDPKYTEPTEWHAEDENATMFHWMTELRDISKPEDFAGWLVMWIRSPLISSADSNSIGIQIEMAGNFNFLQPAPISGGSGPTPPSEAWLDIPDLFGSTGTDDQLPCTFIQVAPSVAKNLSCGFFGARGTNGMWTVDSPQSETSQNIKTNHASMYRGDGTSPVVPAAVKIDPEDRSVRGNKCLLPVNQEQDTQLWSIYTKNGAGEVTEHGMAHKTWFVHGDGAIWVNGGLADTNTQGVISRPTFDLNNEPINIQKTAIAENQGQSSKLSQVRSDESFVLFVNTYFRTLNIQTRDIGDQLARINVTAPTSQLYYIREVGQGTPLMHIRVYSNGCVTAPSSTQSVLFSHRSTYELVFVQELPINLPIPAPTEVMRRFAHKAAKLTAKGARKGFQFSALDAMC